MVATARAILQACVRKLTGLDKRVLELSPLHWGVSTPRRPRIRNRSIELVECERLAALYGSIDVDMSSRTFASAGRLPSVDKPVHGFRRQVRKPTFKKKLSVVIEAQPLSLLCDRCSLKLTGFSSCISDDGTSRVRRCYVCRAKLRVPVYREEVTKTTPRRRSKTNWGDSPAPRTHKTPVNSLPNHQLRKPVRRKLWFRRCEVIPPFMPGDFAQDTRIVTQRGPEEWVLRTLCKDVRYANVGVWRDEAVDQSIPYEIKRRWFRSRRGAGVERLTNSQAALIAASDMNPVNVVHVFGRRSRRSLPRTHWMDKRQTRFTLYTLKLAKWQLQEEHLRKLKAARLEITHRRKMRKLRIQSRHVLQSHGIMPHSNLDIRGVYVSGAVPAACEDGRGGTYYEWEYVPQSTSTNNPFALLEDSFDED